MKHAGLTLHDFFRIYRGHPLASLCKDFAYICNKVYGKKVTVTKWKMGFMGGSPQKLALSLLEGCAENLC